MHDRCPLMVMSAPFMCAVLPIIKTANQGKIMVSGFFAKFVGKTDIFFILQKDIRLKKSIF